MLLFSKVIFPEIKLNFSRLILQTRQSNEESRKVLISQGVTFVPTTDEVVATLEEHRDKTIQKLTGDAFSEDIYEILDQALTTYRVKEKDAAD